MIVDCKIDIQQRIKSMQDVLFRSLNGRPESLERILTFSMSMIWDSHKFEYPFDGEYCKRRYGKDDEISPRASLGRNDSVRH